MNTPPSHSRYHGLDALRTLAITQVMLWHQLSEGGPAWLEQPARFGWSGVDLFFVLSGFLIGSQLLSPVAIGRPPSLREFYIKRFFRILPNFYTVLALYFFVPVFRGHSTLPPLWKFLTFTQNFNTHSLTQGGFSHAWSLCIEEHFYLILPISIVALHKQMTTRRTILFASTVVILGAILRGIAQHIFVAPFNPEIFTPEMGQAFGKWVYNPTYNRLDGLLLGLLLAAAYRLRKDLWEKLMNNGNLISALGTLSLFIGFAASHNKYSLLASVAGFPFISLGYAGWVAAAMSKNSIVFRREIPGTSAIALLAFALYLLDEPMIQLSHRLATEIFGWTVNSNFTLLLSLPMIFGAAWILNRVVERPGLQLRDRVLAKL